MTYDASQNSATQIVISKPWSIRWIGWVVGVDLSAIYAPVLNW